MRICARSTRLAFRDLASQSCLSVGACNHVDGTAVTSYELPAWCRGRPGRNDEAVHIVAKPRFHGQPIVLEPGFVVLRQALGRPQQLHLAKEAWDAGSGRRKADHSFFEGDGTLRGPKGSRGRIYDACINFEWSKPLLDACVLWVRQAQAVDCMMPCHTATHLLLLYYKEGGTLGFHRDVQANDGTGEEPVVNLSLGCEIDFAFRHQHSDVARVITLRSGDVVLFGGPCRKILHAVVATRGVLDNVLPRAAGNSRLSFTLRHSVEVLGYEHLYRDFRPQADDPMHRPTGDEHLLGKAEALRRLDRMKS